MKLATGAVSVESKRSGASGTGSGVSPIEGGLMDVCADWGVSGRVVVGMWGLGSSRA